MIKWPTPAGINSRADLPPEPPLPGHTKIDPLIKAEELRDGRNLPDPLAKEKKKKPRIHSLDQLRKIYKELPDDY